MKPCRSECIKPLVSRQSSGGLYLIQALELRLADCLQKGVAAETELLTVVMSHVAENVKQQLPPQLRDVILGIEAPTWRQDPNAAQQSVSSGLEAIPEADMQQLFPCR